MIYPSDAVEVAGGGLLTMMIKTTKRMCCAACATFLFSDLEQEAGIHALCGTLFPAGEFEPEYHVQCREAVLPVVDNLPHYRDFPAAFGGTGECVAR